MKRATRWIIGLLFLATAILIWGVATALADEKTIRKNFFRESKFAILFSRNPKDTVNCCGEADAVKVKVIGQSKERGLMAVMITDTMRHAFRGSKIKVGQVLTVPPTKIAKWPRVPELFKSHIVFVDSRGKVICFMQKDAGG